MTIIKHFLTLNRYSRNGKKMNEAQGIVVHDCEINDCDAIATRNRFENLKNGKNAVYYGTHYVIGNDGEIINCIPENEITYHRGNNEEKDSYIAITLCTPKGENTPTITATRSLIKLVSDIVKRYSFNINSDFLRHHDLSGRKCPLFYSESEKNWTNLKQQVAAEIDATEQLKLYSAKKIAEIANILGMDEKYIYAVLNDETAPDAQFILRAFEALLSSKCAASATSVE